MNPKDFFQAATGFAPYPYQERLAICDDFPQVLSVPTGVGKTAAAILSWLYRRRTCPGTTPRRLVYCLPMRTLVEQTQREAVRWLKRLSDLDSSISANVHLLMGGADDEKWYEHPEENAILIGTQDMLLSRALNRGYGMSRYMWPVQYSLLNNDCQWIIDETQLMGVGLTTSAQLEGLRRKLDAYGDCRTLWMSATLDGGGLETVDHPMPSQEGWASETILDDDRCNERVRKLLEAVKPCKTAKISFSPDKKKGYEAALAEEVVSAHRAGTLTLVVVNRVDRAQNLFSAIKKDLGKESDEYVRLIHSRFRPNERRDAQAEALDEESISPSGPGRIIVATQAIEAGVDLSATTLFTELAPWSSLVQRFGRCNRRGTCGHDGSAAAQVYWIDIATGDKKGKESALPYTPEELDRAREIVGALDDVGPQSLPTDLPEESQPIVHVLRRKDLLELFDTTPDLSGNDLDISRYIRDSDDTDVQVYWRDWDLKDDRSKPPLPKQNGEIVFPAPNREELCSVSLKRFRDFREKLTKHDKTKHVTWLWDPLDREWEEYERGKLRPGLVVLLHTTAGGYDEELGWTGEPKHSSILDCPPSHGQLPEANSKEDLGEKRVTIEQHLKDVAEEASILKQKMTGEERCQNWERDLPWDEIIRAAWWHDVGKAHPAFQGAMRKLSPELDSEELWAKSGAKGYLDYQIATADDEKPQKRPGFRHELASALAWLQHNDKEPNADLIAYLLASHHGKVRMSIRSMPNENRPDDPEKLFARGIWSGDELPRVEIGNPEGDVCDAVELNLDLMRLGEQDGNPSWLARALRLREELGPFKLAYLETLLRVADWRGTKKGAENQ